MACRIYEALFYEPATFVLFVVWALNTLGEVWRPQGAYLTHDEARRADS